VSEFVTLDDGRRVLLHDGGRGLAAGEVRTTGGWRAPDIRWGLTLEDLARDVLTVVLARSRGLDVTAADLREMPYDVVFTDELRRWLAAYQEETPGRS
jgi:hypothetical protein